MENKKSSLSSKTPLTFHPPTLPPSHSSYSSHSSSLPPIVV